MWTARTPLGICGQLGVWAESMQIRWGTVKYCLGPEEQNHTMQNISMGLVDEVFGAGFAVGRARERSGTPLFPFPPPQSVTPILPK